MIVKACLFCYRYRSELDDRVHSCTTLSTSSDSCLLPSFGNTFLYQHIYLVFNSNKDRQVQEIDGEYVEQVKAKVGETFGQQNRDKVFNQIEDLLRNDKMVC